MGFAGCPSDSGGVREWEEEGQAAAALGFPRAAREGDAGAVEHQLFRLCLCFYFFSSYIKNLSPFVPLFFHGFVILCITF
jgi:hypothetical protein